MHSHQWGSEVRPWTSYRFLIKDKSISQSYRNWPSTVSLMKLKALDPWYGECCWIIYREILLSGTDIWTNPRIPMSSGSKNSSSSHLSRLKKRKKHLSKRFLITLLVSTSIASGIDFSKTRISGTKLKKMWREHAPICLSFIKLSTRNKTIRSTYWWNRLNARSLNWPLRTERDI